MVSKRVFIAAINNENDVSSMIGCLQFVRIYSFMKGKNYTCIRASSIFLLFVKFENDNVINEIKHVLSSILQPVTSVVFAGDSSDATLGE